MPLLTLLMAAAPLIVDPAAISVPPGLSEQVVAKAIDLGAAQRSWILNKQEPRYMEATLKTRSHIERIGIAYDVKTVQIGYLDSSNLDYEVKGDARHIHRNYYKWSNRMSRNISMQLLTASAVTTAT